MHNLKFTMLTNAFSKKFENHTHTVALYAVWYNLCRIHKTLRVSSAMAAGVANRMWSVEDVAEMVEAGLPKPGKRGVYRKRVNEP